MFRPRVDRRPRRSRFIGAIARASQKATSSSLEMLAFCQQRQRRFRAIRRMRNCSCGNAGERGSRN